MRISTEPIFPGDHTGNKTGFGLGMTERFREFYPAVFLILRILVSISSDKGVTR